MIPSLGDVHLEHDYPDSFTVLFHEDNVAGSGLGCHLRRFLGPPERHFLMVEWGDIVGHHLVRLNTRDLDICELGDQAIMD